MKNLYEIMNEVAQAPNDDVRVYILRHNDRHVLRHLLQVAFDPNIQFVFKEPVEFKSSDAPVGMGYTSLDVEFKRVYLFVEGSNKVDANLSFERKKQILIQILESLEAKEAKLFMNMLLKDLQVPGLTYKVVKEAFPDLLP